METTGIENPNKVFYPTPCLESYIAKNKIPISSNNDNTNKGYNLGGLNIIGGNKIYENLKHFDVKSMYPNILISLQASSNLDYLNLKCSTVKKLTGDWKLINETKGTAFYMQKNGLKQAKKISDDEYKVLELDSKFDLTEANNDIANLFKDLLQYKENNTGNLRIAYKKLVNGLYGALDSEKYFKYNHVNLMAVTAFLCRYVLYNCYKEFNGVYAKTDSIWTTNKDLTEEDLNNYSNDLLNRIGIPNSCIKWELESEPDKLLIKDSNNYIEVIGDEYNFKGSYEAPIQKIALKKAIQGGRVNPNNLFNEYKDHIILFCRHIKYSSKKSKELQYNPVIAKIKGYSVESDKKVFNYFSIYGYVNGLEYDEFDLDVNSYYGTSLINQILYDYGFTNKSIPFKTAEAEKEYNKPKFVPMKLKDNDRLVQDNYKLNKMYFKANADTYKVTDTLQNIIVHIREDMDYNGLVLGTNYYSIDIDRKDFEENTDKVKDEILKVFKKGQYILQRTKSNGYHIIFKTNQDKDIRSFEQNSTVEDYRGLELKVNAVLPYDTYKYKVMAYKKEKMSLNTSILALERLEEFQEIDKLKRFYLMMKLKNSQILQPSGIL